MNSKLAIPKSSLLLHLKSNLSQNFMSCQPQAVHSNVALCSDQAHYQLDCGHTWPEFRIFAFQILIDLITSREKTASVGLRYPSGHSSLSAKPAQHTRLYCSKSLPTKNLLELPNLLTYMPCFYLLQLWSFSQPIPFMPLNILEWTLLTFIHLPSPFILPPHLSKLRIRSS